MPVAQHVASAQRSYAAKQIRRTVPVIEKAAARANAAARRVAQAQQSLDSLAGSGYAAVAAATPNDRVMYTMHLSLPVVVYVIDVVLLSAALAFAIRGSATGWFASAVPYTYPACILGMELALAGARYRAVLERLQGEGGVGPVVGWTAAGVACALAVEAPVAAWAYSREAADFDPWISIPMIFGLTCLPLIAHLSIALSGQHSVESKAWLGYALRRRSLASQLRRDETVRAQATQDAALSFTRYTQDLERFNRSQTDDRLAPGPFHRDTQALLQSYFEPAAAGPGDNPTPRDVGMPPSPPPSPTAAGPRPTAEPVGGTDMWAELFARQVRDADSEVRA